MHVAAQELTSGGVLIEVSDSGVGIPEARLAEMNWRLDNPPVIDVSVSRHMGLFAVARLAERHGVRVRLRPAVPARADRPGLAAGQRHRAGSQPVRRAVPHVRHAAAAGGCRRARHAHPPGPGGPAREPPRDVIVPDHAATGAREPVQPGISPRRRRTGISTGPARRRRHRHRARRVDRRQAAPTSDWFRAGRRPTGRPGPTAGDRRARRPGQPAGQQVGRGADGTRRLGCPARGPRASRSGRLHVAGLPRASRGRPIPGWRRPLPAPGPSRPGSGRTGTDHATIAAVT